jgi:hypothetical protein
MRATRRDDYSRDRKPQVEEQVTEAPAASEKVEVEAKVEEPAPVKKTTQKAAPKAQEDTAKEEEK